MERQQNGDASRQSINIGKDIFYINSIYLLERGALLARQFFYLYVHHSRKTQYIDIYNGPNRAIVLLFIYIYQFVIKTLIDAA